MKRTKQVGRYLCIFCQIDQRIQLVTAGDVFCFYPFQVHSEVVGSFSSFRPGLMQLGLHTHTHTHCCTHALPSLSLHSSQLCHSGSNGYLQMMRVPIYTYISVSASVAFTSAT